MRWWVYHLRVKPPLRRPVLTTAHSVLYRRLCRASAMGKKSSKKKSKRHQDEDEDEDNGKSAARTTTCSVADGRGMASPHTVGSVTTQQLASAESNLHVVVDSGDCGNRLDSVLPLKLKLAPPLTRGRVQRAVKAGCVRVNGKVATKTSQKMRLGDVILWDEVAATELAASSSLLGLVRPEPHLLHIYREDNDLILLEKPIGMPVHPAGRLRTGTLVNALLHHTGHRAIQQGAPEPEIESAPGPLRPPVSEGLYVGDTIDVQTADGLERGARILGPSESGDASAVRVIFSDGVVDDWDLKNCRPSDARTPGAPEPEVHPQLDPKLQSDAGSKPQSQAALICVQSPLKRLGEGEVGCDDQETSQQLSIGGKMSESERFGGIVRPGIVHRLDRGTSGVMVVAKNDASHAHLSSQFEHRTTRRLYLAIVWGVPLQATGRIETHMGRDPGDRLRQAVLPPGKTTRYAATNYTVLATLDNGNLAVLRFALETGRTHQVSQMPHPVRLFSTAFVCLT